MVRHVHFKGALMVAAGCLFAAAVSAQDTTAQPAVSAPAAAANPIVTAPGTATPTTGQVPPRPRRARAISAELAAQLSAVVPKYTPPPPKPPPTPEEDQPDLRDVDKPKNGIIRLPKYVVHDRSVVLTERAVNTRAGLADIAMKRYGTEWFRALNGFTLPLFGTSPENMALAQYEEDERLKAMASLSDDARMVNTTSKSDGQYVKKQVQDTFTRPGDFDWKPMGR